MESLHHKLAEVDPASAEYAAVADRLHHIDTEFRNRDGYAIEAQVGTVLNGLGFRKEDWARRTEEFSGGWQMRIALAKLLLEKPNLLLLDEPTNHLDLEARNWLESYLTSYPYRLRADFARPLLSGRDREPHGRDLEQEGLVLQRQLREISGAESRAEAQLEAAYKNQRERIEQLEAFINRFRCRGDQGQAGAKSRIKELEKIERIEIPPDEQTIHFTFPQPKPSGRIVAEFKDVSKSYGAKHVFSGANFVIERGDRIALVGVNGAGKSTLIKLLAGTEPLTSGRLYAGPQRDCPIISRRISTRSWTRNARMLDDLSDAAAASRPRPNCGRCSDVSCSATTTCSRKSACYRAASATATRWRGCCWLRRTSCCWTSRPITWTCAPRTCCSNRCASTTGTVVFVSHDRYFIDNLADANFRDRRRSRPRLSGKLRRLFVAESRRPGTDSGRHRRRARAGAGAGRSGRRFKKARQSDEASEAASEAPRGGEGSGVARIGDRAA